ncbi:MAG: carbohydrate-binding domain-containing protein [Anaerocolumna sp.]
MKKSLKYFMAVMTITAMIFTGCAANSNKQVDSDTDSTITGNTDTGSTVTDGTAGTVAAETAASSQVVLDTEFSAKDLEVGCEESTATDITLKEGSIDVSGDGAAAKDSIVIISKEGTYVITGTLKNGQIVVDAGDSDKVHIILNGVTVTYSTNAPIYIKNADKVFITLNEGTENVLTDGTDYVQSDDNNVDGVIFSKADLTINGDGSLDITGNYKHGIVSKDDLIITGGTINVTAVKDALNGKDCVKIKEGILTLNVTEGNGIQSKNGDDATKGYVYIAGGDITVLNCEEGIEGTVILIEDGTINVTAKDDGLNAASGSSDTTDAAVPDTKAVKKNNEVNETNLAVNPEKDTVNETAASANQTTDAISGATTNTEDGQKPGNPGDGNFNGDFGRGGFGGGGGAFEADADCYISIKGGTIHINASGDGIDSNGYLYISGGTTYVSGPTDNGNGALDYNGTAVITGGTVIAAGSTGMAQGFSDTSTQYSLLYNLTASSAAGTEVKLSDQSGNEMISYTPDKEYQSVVISTPELEKDGTYTLTSGEQTAQIILTSIATSNGQQGMGGSGGHRGQPGQDGNTTEKTAP